MNDQLHISVITPVYKCKNSLDELYERLNTTLYKINHNFEIIMIDDSSPDDAWEKILHLSQKDKKVKGIKLSKNFGQHSAITAGLNYAKGKWIVVMDCDLQDKPEEISKLYNKAIEGYDIVLGKRHQRKDNLMTRFLSKLFYKTLSYFTSNDFDERIAQFGIFSNKVLETLKQFEEQNRAFALIMFLNIVGFKKTEIDIEHLERKEGKSSYSLSKKVNMAINLIVSHSNKPLILSIKIGFLISLFSFTYGFWLIIKYFIWGINIQGWTSVMVSVYFIGGLLFANIGLVGFYISKVFDETKKRPIYIIEETTFKL